MLSVLSLFFCLSISPAGEIINATVAQVKNHVITTREVQINYVLDRLLKFDPYLEKTQDPVEQLIQDWLLYFEASEFYSSPLSAETVTQKLRDIEPKFRDVKDWDKLDVTQKELQDIMARKLEARRLYTFKKKASALPVTNIDVESEYKQNRHLYGTASLAEVREKIRARKLNENLNERLNNWFEVLEKKYRVQRFAKYNQN